MSICSYCGHIHVAVSITAWHCAFYYHHDHFEKAPLFLFSARLRYPPYSDSKLGWLKWVMKKKVKRAGLMGFLPFMVLGGMFAMFVKVRQGKR